MRLADRARASVAGGQTNRSQRLFGAGRGPHRFAPARLPAPARRRAARSSSNCRQPAFFGLPSQHLPSAGRARRWLRPRGRLPIIHAATITPALGTGSILPSPASKADRSPLCCKRSAHEPASFVVKVLFGLLILSFGFWGIYTRSPFSSDQSPDTAVATVGERDIRRRRVAGGAAAGAGAAAHAVRQHDRRAQVKQLGIVDTVLGQLIDRELARPGGAAPAARPLRRRDPQRDHPESGVSRRRTASSTATQFNAAAGDEPADRGHAVERVRHDIPRGDLLQAMTAGVSAPQPVVDALYRYRNEKRRRRHRRVAGSERRRCRGSRATPS